MRYRIAGALAVGLGLAAVAVASPVQAASPNIVLSEVYGGGGNTGAPYANDFVELYNRGTSAVSVAGWSVQYASASGTTWLTTALTGSVAPGGYYLVKLAAGTSGGAALPTPDATGTTNMSATSGKVALVTSTSALTCGSNCATATGVRDFLGYGSANDSETSPAPAGSNTVSVNRTNPAADADNNATEFATAAPSPKNTTSGGGDTCGYPSPRIRDIQGAAHISPKNGQAVSGVRGVVTAVGSKGFWFQDPCPDANPATSEGLYVFTNAAGSAVVGQDVAVDGTVSEYRSGGASSTNLTVTEIATPTVSVVASGKPVPAATVIGSGGRVPPATVIDDDANGDVETSGTFDATTDGIDFYESMEGMRVQVTAPKAVGPSNSNGEIPVIGDTGTVRTNRGGIMIRSGDFNPERVILDDYILAGSTPTGVNVGDTFTGPAVGIMDYSAGNYKLDLTGALTRVSGGLTPETTAATPAGQLSVATFNVQNLAPSDPQSKYDGLANVIVNNLAKPGILVVEEVQDNDGATNSAVVDASQTWAKLIAAISTAGGPTYDYRSINPVDDQDGGQPGGNIRVGFLFRTDIGLSFVPGTAGDSTTAVGVVNVGGADKVGLTLNPGRVDPGNAAWAATRKPLVGEFRYAGAPLFVIANHWSSKGGDDPLFGRNQPPVHSSEVKRGQQGDVVAAFVSQILAVDSQARIVVAGDLNDFEFSVAVGKLITAGMTDLPSTLPDAERYSYVYEGNSQFLDHILVSPYLAAKSYGYDVVHVNSEFAVQVSDHDPQIVRLPLP
ncbi:endonuclease [Longispora fulva]|uniref:Putative extracellular nuclease n=1 Tax=Longispora fulva TaxID=619741 RepID=A0A8J7GCA8_9ACTN|nr:lamin tail domain-containing protein [Longispora fulva]MBG6137913.1 putative extracellular nuclease [Longispora fulva]GIG60166.1 endonuclease [Longispora fulva]